MFRNRAEHEARLRESRPFLNSDGCFGANSPIPFLVYPRGTRTRSFGSSARPASPPQSVVGENAQQSAIVSAGGGRRSTLQFRCEWQSWIIRGFLSVRLCRIAFSWRGSRLICKVVTQNPEPFRF
ncbi:uncharacterized protein VTP21DRAFT_1321 [Calcarisporiella thermophila]|uniref:uncharacterized protein n=1 Tax=Calcarisporiella thermophila TaxID=911321 RepID=UPI003742ADCF